MASSGVYESDFEEDVSAYNAGADSDDESLVEADSPSDGYFTQRDHPQETFVENSAVQAESEAKAREAEEERATTAAAARPPSNHSSPTRSPVYTDESTPLLDAGPPPPDYAAATAHRREPRQPSQGQPEEQVRLQPQNSVPQPPPPPPAQPPAAGEDRQWPFGNRGNPFAATNFPFGEQGGPFGIQGPFGRDHPLVRNGLLGEQGIFGSRNRPQSMRDPPSAPADAGATSGLRGGGGQEERADEETWLIAGHQQGRRSRKSWRRRGCWCCRPRSLLAWALFFGLIVAIVLAARAIKGGSKGDNTPSDGDVQDPDKKPVKAPEGPMPTHPHTAQCPFNSYSETLRFDFTSPSDFSFIELIDAHDYRGQLPAGARISGTIQISPAPEDQDTDIRVWVSIATTRPLEVKRPKYWRDGDGLELMLPDLEEIGHSHGRGWMDSERACMDIAVAIKVQKGVNIGSWEMCTHNLDVIIDGGLFSHDDEGAGHMDDSRRLVVRNESSISAARGNIKVSYWSSRRTVIKTISGQIRGTYALRDYLSLQSESGSISVGVEPRKVDKSHPKPAEFLMKTSSGSVHANFPTGKESEITKREYTSRVETHSGSIRGSYILGSKSSFSTYSASIEVDVLPYSADLFDSRLRTSTHSGHTRVLLLSPYTTDSSFSDSAKAQKYNDGIIDSFHSSHKTTSGSVSLIYPQEWQGTIDCQSTSGSLKVHGKDVDVIVDEDLPGLNRLIARKGQGRSKLNVRTASASVNVLVGDD